ncbi:MAG: hypothetical protein R2819_01570 [Allomuricauda sp.]|jgi:hypothetical protein|uniref:hypothetical protein n=1 Tax=Flagellimonas amoyensis TaxID=2169401 RepID=UPI000D376F33|nr:hypothetical protein [Allomuricauda amoyensis]
MHVKLSEIFIYKTDTVCYTKTALLELGIKTEFGMRLAKHLGLAYMERETGADNLCYAQAPDIRSGYRQVLTKTDLREYLDKVLEPGIHDMESGALVFPKSIDF